MATPDPDYYVKSLQFTKRSRRDVYPAVDPTNPELSLAGKVVIITGASRGIGARGMVPAFAKAGAKALVLVARNAEKLNAVAEEAKALNSKLETLVYPLDITDEPGIKALFEKVNATYGHADILVNNAGVSEATAMLTDVDPQLWWEGLAVNVKATYFPTSHFLKSLPASAPGTVVNITTAAHYVIPSMSAYMLGKLATMQLTAFVAAESAAAGKDVAAYSVYPGIVQTDMTLEMLRPFAHDTPALAGGVSVWLCSEKARFLNGRFVSVNWDVEDLCERQEEIVEGRLLEVGLTGQFGSQHFQ